MRTTAVIVLAAAFLAQNAPDTKKNTDKLNGSVGAQCSDNIGTIAGFGNSQISVQTQFSWTLTQPPEQLDALTFSLSQSQPFARTASCNLPFSEIDDFLAAVELVEEVTSRNYDEEFDTAGAVYTAKQGPSLAVTTTPPNAMNVIGESRVATVSYSNVSVFIRVEAIATLKSLVMKARDSINNRQPELERMRQE